MDGGATKEGAGAGITATTTSTAGRQAGSGSAAGGGLWSRVTDRLPFLRTKRGIAVTVVAILVILGGGLAGLAALRNRNGADGSGSGSDGSTGSGSSNAIKDDTYFYGMSPAVYPSREFLCFGPLLPVSC